MNSNEWKAFVDGNLQAIILACTSMIATHPEKEKVMALLSALSKVHAQPEQGDNSETKHYKDGIRGAVSTIQGGVDQAQLAEQINDLKNQTGSH